MVSIIQKVHETGIFVMQKNEQVVLAREVAQKDRQLAEAARTDAKKQQALNTARDELANLTKRAAGQEEEISALTRQIVKLGAALTAESEERQWLGRQLDSLRAEKTALEGKGKAAAEAHIGQRNASEALVTQLRAEEAAHVATKAALQQAQRELAHAQHAMQAAHTARAEAEGLRLELRLLGKELLREQEAIEKHNEQCGAGGVRAAVGAPGQESLSAQVAEAAARSESLAKLNSLHRRLFAATEQITHQSQIMAGKDEEIAKLRKALVLRKESDAAVHELGRCRAELQKKERQLRAATAEMALLASKVEQLECDKREKDNEECGTVEPPGEPSGSSVPPLQASRGAAAGRRQQAHPAQRTGPPHRHEDSALYAPFAPPHVSLSPSVTQLRCGEEGH